MKSVLRQKHEKVVNIATWFSNILIWPLAFINLFAGKNHVFIAAVIFIMLVNIAFVLYRKKRNFSTWADAILVFMGVSIVYIFWEGGIEGAGHLWVFLFPVVAYEFKGHIKANSFIIVLYSILLLIYLISYNQGFAPSYQTPRFMMVYFIVLIAVTVFLFGYEKRKKHIETITLQSKRKYEALFNDLTLGVVMLDRNFRILEANNTMRKWFPELNSGKELCCYHNFHPENKGTVCPNCPVKKCFEDGELHTLEQKKQTPKGEKVYRLVANPMYNGAGEVYAAIETLEDITVQKHIQQEMIKREETFRSLVTSLSDVVYTLDTQQHYTGVYGEWVERSGYAPEYFPGKSVRDILGAEAALPHEQANTKALTGQTVVYDWSVVSNDVTFYYQTSVSPLFNQDRQIVGLVGVARDISVLKNTEEALKESEQRFRALAENSSAGIYLFQDNSFKMVNHGLTQITGYSRQELLSMGQTEVVHPDHREMVMERARKRKKGDSNLPSNYEMKILTKSGSVRWVDHSVALIQFQNKPATIGTIFDVTEARLAREKIAFQNDFFKMIARISGSFISARADNIDDKINEMLQICGQYLGVDHTFLFQFSKDLLLVTKTHEWCREEIPSQTHNIKSFSIEKIPWMNQLILNRQMFFVPDVDNLSKEYDTDKKGLQQKNIKSILSLPVVKDEVAMGCFGFDKVKEKCKIDEEQVQLMKVVTNILGDALVKVEAEKTMQVMNERFDQLSRQSRSITFEINEKGLYTSISSVVKELLGYEPSEVTGKKYFYDFFPPAKQKQYVADIFEQLRRREPVTNYLNELITKDGETVWVSTSSLPLFDSSGKFKGYWGIDRDVTRQVEMERAIQYQSYLQALTSDVSRLFVSANNENIDQRVKEALKLAGTFFEVNRAFIYRFSPDGKNYRLTYEWCSEGIEPTPPNIRKDTSFTDFPWWFKQISQNNPVLIEDTSQMPPEAAKEKEALLSMNVKSLFCFPVFDHDKITGFVGFDTVYLKTNWTVQASTMQLIAKILSDALEKNKAEKALIASEQLNRETAKELESYLYVASHDLRAPLVNIQGFSNRIQKQIGQLSNLVLPQWSSLNNSDDIQRLLKEKMPVSLTFILSSVGKMDALINGLLAISRTGRVEMKIKEIDVGNLMEKIIANHSFQILQAKAHIKVGKLPSCYGDYQLLHQLFSNLLDNALKYHRPHMAPEIIIDSTTRKNIVTYSIKDNGVGIDAKNYKKIWDVFYRVDPESGQEGDGIGLNLAAKVVAKHKGAIWVDSLPGEGSTFFVQLNREPF